MSSGAADGWPRKLASSWRGWSLLAALGVLLVALLPPLSGAARRTEYAQALQISLLAIAVPALFVAGAPWQWLKSTGEGTSDSPSRMVDRLADGRLRHRELPRSLAFIGVDIAVIIGWHTPEAVSAVSDHGWLAPVEALTFLVFGAGLWLELVQSPPFAPRSGHLRCAVLAALAMWALWIVAYVVGMSNHDFYTSFHHVPGGLSSAADQQIASAVFWLVSALAFLPVVFWNALMWLKTEDDPDTELMGLMRAERRSAPPLAGGGGDGGMPAS